jgi:hypothetical protein
MQYPSAGKTYTLKVFADSFENVSSEIYIPMEVEITDVLVSSYKSNTGGFSDSFHDMKATISFTMPKENVINYYMLTLKSEGINYNGEYIFHNNPIAFTSKDVALVGDKSGETGFGDEDYDNKFNVFTDELISGNTYKLDVMFNEYEVLSTGQVDENGQYIYDSFIDTQFRVIINSISEDYYKFLKSYENQLSRGDSPFTEPFQLWSNVIDGAGIGAGYSIEEKKSHFGQYALVIGMTVDDVAVSIDKSPFVINVLNDDVELYIPLFNNFSCEVYKDGVLINNRAIGNSYFMGNLTGLVQGDNNFIIKIISDLGAVINYDLVVVR